MLSEKWRPSPPVEQEKMAYRERSGTTAPTTRHGEPVLGQNLQENIAKLDSFK